MTVPSASSRAKRCQHQPPVGPPAIQRRAAPARRWQAAVAFVHRLGERIGDPGAHPDHCRLFDAELHGNGVGGLETDATDVARQPIGVLGHDLHGVGAVGLVDPHRPRRADPWLCRKTMISRTIFCSAQASVIRLARTCQSRSLRAAAQARPR